MARILIADDNPQNLYLLETLLKGYGYEVTLAGNGAEALDLARGNPPNLVITDILMPGMDGFEMCRHWKADERLRQVPLIFYTAQYTDPKDEQFALSLGAERFLIKPQQPEVLAQIVREVLDQQAQGTTASPAKVAEEEQEVSQQYSEVLFRQLEKKVVELEHEIGERKKIENQIEERLRFEQLLADLSARLVDLSPAEADSAINRALKEILEFFQVERCGLLQIFPDKASWQVSYLAVAEGVPPPALGVEFPASLFPYAYDQLVHKREIHSFSKLDDLPAEAGMDRQTSTDWGIRSCLYIPIIIEGPVVHAIAIDSVTREHVWPQDFVPRLRLLGEIFANALERKRNRLEIEERLRFERLISDLSAGFVNLPPDEVGSEINRGLRSITEFFDADRCTIGLFSDDRTLLALVFEYVSPGAEPAPESISKDQMPWYLEQLILGNPVVVNRLEDLPPEAEKERQLCLLKSMKSILSVPMISGGKTLGSCALVATRTERSWPEELVQRFRLLTQVFVNAMHRKQMEEQLRQNLREIENLKQRLERENVYLQEEVKLLVEHSEMVGQSLVMKKVLSQAEQVAKTDSTVLILGETGTGKKLLARAIHGMSSRKARPLVTVNCASLPPTLIESELFGRERGAYTGALTRMIGRFEIADGSTLFLDEIGELPPELQSKLLRVLEEGDFERLGSTKTLHVNVRIMAATNRDIEQAVREGEFRNDLFYRLNVFPIVVPPLRERAEDIPLLVWSFVREFQKKMGKKVEKISKKAMEELQTYSWPGNVRELRNVIERAMITSNDKTLVVQAPRLASSERPEARSLEDMERSHIVSVLERHGWRVSGAADVLGLKRSTLYSKMKKLGIQHPNT
jgi:formate hydrogenlyase transcriptional activator